MAKGSRDVERVYDLDDTVAKLRRLADALESGSTFRIQVAGERIRVPKRAQFSIEHERGDEHEEVEFQLKWTISDDGPDDDADDDSDDATEPSSPDV